MTFTIINSIVCAIKELAATRSPGPYCVHIAFGTGPEAGVPCAQLARFCVDSSKGEVWVLYFYRPSGQAILVVTSQELDGTFQ